MTLGVDVGGTFTDLVRWEEGELVTAKVSTTTDQGVGVSEGVRALLGDHREALLLHGTTVATNALLEGKGARVALVADAGFEDLIEIGRQDRPSLYDPFHDRPPALVAPELRLGWPGELDLGDAEAVAVALLGSYADGAAEMEVANSLGDIPLSISHRVSPEFREYERIATTVLNAYLQPVVATYLEGLSRRLAEMVARILILRSSGGLTSVAGASQLAASILLSGPAGGVVAAAACGAAHGWDRLISFDMGGTSTDVCRIEHGQPEVLLERTLEGITCRMPSVAIHTIGAGGGSIAWADQGGALRVGPHSAGAHPGPACYGRGGNEATVTDANVLTGRLGSESPLAGGLPLDEALAHDAIASLAAALGMEPLDAANGILEVVDTHMVRALRRVSIEQGADPRTAALIAFGGAGGLHATSLGRRLGVPAVLVPSHAGVFSALGLLLSSPRHDLVRTLLLEGGDKTLPRRIEGLVAEATDRFADEVGQKAESIEIAAHLRYLGQSHETRVEYRPGDTWETLTERFHEAHAVANGFSQPGSPVELVNVQVTAMSAPALRWDDLPPHRPVGDSIRGKRVMPDGTSITRFNRSGIAVGEVIWGPAVIEEDQATTWLHPGDRAVVQDDGTLELTW